MIKPIWLLIIGVFFMVVFFTSAPQALMSNTIQSVPVSVATLAFSGEIKQIEIIVDEFLELRQIRSNQEAQTLAEKLDYKINNLQLVKMNCESEISSLELAFAESPYEKLQEICPALKNVSFGKAVQLFGMI